MNEDAILDRPGEGLWAVADGLGGHQLGALASRLVIDRLAALPLHGDLHARADAVAECLQRANEVLIHMPAHPAGKTRAIAGSTVVVVVAAGERAVCLWAGDSRCYLWRKQKLYQLSRDHAVEQARGQPSGLTRAVGARAQLQLGSVEFEIQANDGLLLCSDGLYRQVSNQALAQAMRLPLTTVVLDQLFGQVLTGRAPDNLSAVVVRP